MKIETKYDIGDEVYYMYQNQIYHSQVYGIDLQKLLIFP